MLTAHEKLTIAYSHHLQASQPKQATMWARLDQNQKTWGRCYAKLTKAAVVKRI